MALTLLPTPPSRSDPVNFPSRADTFMAALQNFVVEFNSQLPYTVAGLVSGNFQVTGTTRLENTGIGTSTFSLNNTGRGLLEVNGSTDSLIAFKYSDNVVGYIRGLSTSLSIVTGNATTPMIFSTNTTERMRIDASTPSIVIGATTFAIGPGTNRGLLEINGVTDSVIAMRSGGTHVGTIQGTSTYMSLSAVGATIPLTLNVNGAEALRIDTSRNVGIGTNAPNASSILDVQSTTKGVRFPNMTTTQKNAISGPAAGLVVFDTTLSKLCVYTGSAWQIITSA